MSEKQGFKLVGLRLKGKTTNAENQSGKDCGSLWKKFETDRIFDLIPAKLSNEIYAVYFDYDNDETGPFSYFIGCKADPLQERPSGLDELTIPAQAYTLFTAKGAIPDCIKDTWKKIWSSGIKRKLGFDFEVYDERSRNWNNAEVDIYISTVE
jgi:predicted transcriptional regulator YdeE